MRQVAAAGVYEDDAVEESCDWCDVLGVEQETIVEWGSQDWSWWTNAATVLKTRSHSHSLVVIRNSCCVCDRGFDGKCPFLLTAGEFRKYFVCAHHSGTSDSANTWLDLDLGYKAPSFLSVQIFGPEFFLNMKWTQKTTINQITDWWLVHQKLLGMTSRIRRLFESGTVL